MVVEIKCICTESLQIHLIRAIPAHSYRTVFFFFFFFFFIFTSNKLLLLRGYTFTTLKITWFLNFFLSHNEGCFLKKLSVYSTIKQYKRNFSVPKLFFCNLNFYVAKYILASRKFTCTRLTDFFSILTN